MDKKELDRDLSIVRTISFVAAAIVESLIAVVFEWMWNATLPELFGLNQIEYLQSLIFVVLFYFVVRIFKAK